MSNKPDTSNDLGFMFALGPRRNPDGTTTIYCRQCSRPITRMARAPIRTVSKCALCIAREQGIKDPEKHIMPQYLMTDPSQPPIPLTEDDPVYALFPEEAMNQGKTPPSGGVIGTVKAFYRAVVGWWNVPEEEPIPMLSKKITRQKRSGGLYER